MRIPGLLKLRTLLRPRSNETKFHSPTPKVRESRLTALGRLIPYVVGTLLAVLAILSLIFVPDFLLRDWLRYLNTQSTLSVKDYLDLQNSSRATLAQVLAGTVLALGAFLTWRNIQTTREEQITTRFIEAIKLLGAERNDKSPMIETRLGAIYALERIAKDSPRDHWTVMETLTAYVRENCRREPSAIASPRGFRALIDMFPTLHRISLQDTSIDTTDTAYQNEAKIPRTDVQAVLTVMKRRNLAASEKSQGKMLDLIDVDLDGVDLNEAQLDNVQFRGTYLRRAHLSEAKMNGADLSLACLGNAELFGTRLIEVHLIGADLEGANMTGAHLNGADLTWACLIGAHLEGAHLEGARLSWARLVGANLFGANLDGAKLLGTHLDGANLRRADLRNAIDLTMNQLKTAKLDDETKLDAELKAAYDTWKAEQQQQSQEPQPPT